MRSSSKLEAARIVNCILSRSIPGEVARADAHLCFKVELDDAGLGMSETEKKSKNFMANWLSKAETTKRKSRDFDEKNDQDNKREKK